MRPLSSLCALWRRLLGDERGNFAIILGICAIPLLGIIGLGIDLTRAYIVQVRLQGAVDNAALAAATLGEEDEDLVKKTTKNYFYSNYHVDFWAPPAEPVITITDGTVRVDATAALKNYFLVLFGYDSFTIAANAEAVGQAMGLEVVMVLDITTSMLDPASKFSSMKIAAKDLVDILFGDTTVNSKLKIGLVPFAGSVRVDPAVALAKGWIDTAGASKFARQNFDNNQFAYQIYTNSALNFPSEMVDTPWQGCVEARPTTSGGVHLEETDTAPSAGDPDTQWVPFFSPDNPDDDLVDDVEFRNDYLDDETSLPIPIIGDILAALLGHQNYSAKYAGESPSEETGLDADGPGRMCVDSPITAMTSDKKKITDAIDALSADGYTHVQLGAAWGWRVISPGEPYTEGKPYNDPDWDKALIILTDGDNTVPESDDDDDLNLSDYTAYGFAAQARLGAGINTPDEVEDEQNASLARVCNNIKAVKRPDGSNAIRVYTIAFGDEVSKDGIQKLLEDCASSPSNYFYAPTNQMLKDSFQAIATELSKIRLTK